MRLKRRIEMPTQILNFAIPQALDNQQAWKDDRSCHLMTLPRSAPSRQRAPGGPLDDGYFKECARTLVWLNLTERLFPHDPVQAPRLSEMHWRLDQLSHILNLAGAAEAMTAETGRAFADACRDALAEEGWVHGKAFSHAMMSAHTHAESFYVTAFRVVAIARNVSSDLFDKNKLVAEPKGVCRVRNLLILHPEHHREGPVLSSSFAVFDNRGTVLKNRREPQESQDPIDEGLWGNAEEFRIWMMTWAIEAHTRLEGRPPPHSAGPKAPG